MVFKSTSTKKITIETEFEIVLGTIVLIIVALTWYSAVVLFIDRIRLVEDTLVNTLIYAIIISTIGLITLYIINLDIPHTNEKEPLPGISEGVDVATLIG